MFTNLQAVIRYQELETFGWSDQNSYVRCIHHSIFRFFSLHLCRHLFLLTSPPHHTTSSCSHQPPLYLSDRPSSSVPPSLPSLSLSLFLGRYPIFLFLSHTLSLFLSLTSCEQSVKHIQRERLTMFSPADRQKRHTHPHTPPTHTHTVWDLTCSHTHTLPSLYIHM